MRSRLTRLAEQGGVFASATRAPEASERLTIWEAERMAFGLAMLVEHEQPGQLGPYSTANLIFNVRRRMAGRT